MTGCVRMGKEKSYYCSKLVLKIDEVVISSNFGSHTKSELW